MEERLGKDILGSCPDAFVDKYARIVRVLNHQRLSEILQSFWAFSIALDMATHTAVVYFDILLRLRWNGSLCPFSCQRITGAKGVFSLYLLQFDCSAQGLNWSCRLKQTLFAVASQRATGVHI
eukprot:IDg20108t1